MKSRPEKIVENMQDEEGVSVGGGGHPPQHKPLQPGARPHSPANPQSSGQQRHIISSDERSRSAPADERPPPSLDPTGMFRNRGRRKIAGSRNSPVRTSSSQNQNQQQQQPQGQRISYRRRYDSAHATSQHIVATTQPHEDSAGEPQNHAERIQQEDHEHHRPPQSLPLDANPGGLMAAAANHSQENGAECKDLDCPDTTADRSHGSDGERASNVGSTVSTMGSISGEGECASTIDEARLLAVKRRAMDDVAEVLDEEGEGDGGAGSTTKHDNDALNITLASQAHNADSHDALNISLEVNADTDTSLLEDYPADDITSPSNAATEATNNVDANNKNAINDAGSVDHEPIHEHESPLRAAFRRSAQGLSNHLPPLSAQMLATAPYRASDVIDKAATTASFFPQLARQCFSFEDTTIDDRVLVIPSELRLDGEGGQSATHHYGLSGIHLPDVEDAPSAASRDPFRRNAPNWHPPHRTRLSNGEPGSPFRVIRSSNTWDHDGVGRPTSSSIRLTTSFDPWSPPSIGRESWSSWKDPVEATSAFGDREKLIGRVGQDSEEERDGKKLKTEREDAVALRSRLHSAEAVISSQQEEIRRLHEVLSQYRAEIGRPNGSQSSKSEHGLPANRSILSSDSSSDGSVVAEGRESLNLCSPAVKPSGSYDESWIQWEQKIEAEMNLQSRKEILLLRAALERANQKIHALEHPEEQPFHSEIDPIERSNEDGDADPTFLRIADEIEATVSDDDNKASSDFGSPTIELDDPRLEKELHEYRTALIASLRAEESGRSTRQESREASHLSQSESNSSEKMVNVRMIDGSSENFSTEWGDNLPLPPPPDHGLHSPIVDAVLSAWTDDSETKSALIGWIEDILSGTKMVDSMPSLKLSGLDHQVRDGFVMHVLPLLLRRKDLCVHLTSRAHRRTTYDIAVSVRQSVSSHGGVSTGESQRRQKSDDIQLHRMAYQATQSGAAMKGNDESQMIPKESLLTSPFPALMKAPSNAGSMFSAVTTPMSNQSPSRKGPLIGRHMYTSLSSEMMKNDNSFTHASPSLMDDLSVASSADDDADIRSLGVGLLSHRNPSSTQNETRESLNNEELPHHRVVTAPSGKLGLTFVDYRGHAVISRVLPESPLAGWVFPSDVLIAIDGIPVSGLRTRDIVKLLTEKAGERRNLRIVSSTLAD